MGFANYENYDRAARAAAAVASYYGGSRTKTITETKNKMQPQPVEYAEYTRHSVRRGRKRRRTLRRAHQLLDAFNQRINLRWQLVNPFNTIGALPLRSWTAVAAGRSYFPIYLVDLHSFVNNVNGTVTSGTPVLTVTQDFTTKNIIVDAVSGTTETGSSTTTAWTYENAPAVSNNFVNVPFRSSVHKWVDIKMLCYGAVNVPVKYDISVVSFPREQFNLPYQASIQTVPGTLPINTVTQGCLSLFEYLVHPYAFNPISLDDTAQAKKIRFHHREQFVVQPHESNIEDTSPHMKEFRWFQTFDQIRRYDWYNANLLNNSTNVGLEVDRPSYLANNAANQTNVLPNQRKYLMIRAQSTQNAIFNGLVQPSFDLVVRTSHKVAV